MRVPSSGSLPCSWRYRCSGSSPESSRTVTLIVDALRSMPPNQDSRPMTHQTTVSINLDHVPEIKLIACDMDGTTAG